MNPEDPFRQAASSSEIPPQAPASPEESTHFPGKEHILSLLQEIPDENIEILGNIEDVLGSGFIAEHTNEVEIAELISEGKNHFSAVRIKDQDGAHYCIFKPVDGENPDQKRQMGFESYAPLEVLAFRVCEHFGLDIVPPTVMKTIKGRTGALQHFLPVDSHATIVNIHPERKEHWQEVWRNLDYQAIALLDFILLNPDRNNANILVEAALTGTHTDEYDFQVPTYETPQDHDPKMYAIDHGISMSPHAYYEYMLSAREMGGVIGPSVVLTTNIVSVDKRGIPSLRGKDEEVPIAEAHLEKLRQGYENRAALPNESVYEIFQSILPEGRELSDQKKQSINRVMDYMWQRVRALIETGHFLSYYNMRKMPDHTINPENPHPRVFGRDVVHQEII